MSFFQKLEKRSEAIHSLLCIGIDPHKAELPEFTVDAAREFCIKLVEATSEVAAAYKPNVAFFEVLGAPGVALLEELCLRIIPDGIPIVLDAKRGDVGSTSEAYAEACYRLAGSVTVSAYLGGDSLDPFLKDPSKAPWALCKTSNPGSNDLQTLEVDTHDGGREPLYMRVARMAEKRGVRGLVVGATDVIAMERIRKEFDDMWFLSPGIGAQGGDLEATMRAGLNTKKSGLLLPISRGISRADNIAEKAREFRDSINALR